MPDKRLSLDIQGMPDYTGTFRNDALNWKKRTLSDKEAHRLLIHRIQAPDTDTSQGRLNFSRQWHLNYAFTYGHQSFRHAYVGLMRDYERHLPPEPTYTANLILPHVCSQVSNLTSSPIDWRVPQKTPQVEDRNAALVGQKVLVSMHHELDVEAARKEAVLWSAINGNGFIRVGYKPYARIKAKVYKDPVTGKKRRASELSEAAKHRLSGAGLEEEDFEGMPFVEALGSPQVTVPILSTGMSINSAPWLIVSTRMHMSEAANRFGREAALKLEPDGHSERLWDFYQRSIKTMVLYGGGVSALQDREQEELVTIHEMWEPPSALKPDGLYLAGTRHTHVQVDKYEPGARRYPVAKIGYRDLPGRFWGKGMVEDLIQPQRSLNMGRSAEEAIRDRMAFPKLWIPTNSGVADEHIDANFAILHGKKTHGPPVYLVATGASDHQSLEIMDGHISSDMDTIADRGQVSQGHGAPGVRSADQTDMLIEQNLRAVGSAVTSQELAMRDVGSMILFEVQKHFTDKRLIPIYGADRQSDVMDFSADMLRGHTEVHVQEGSLLPRSPALEKRNIAEAAALGMLNPQDPETLRLYGKAARLQNVDAVLSVLAMQERRAEEENKMFASDDPTVGMPMVEEFDDHAVHAKKHLEYLLSDTYEVQTLEAPVLARSAVAHYQKHIQLQQQQQMMLMQMQEAMKGGPGEKGQPSQPKQPAESGRKSA